MFSANIHSDRSAQRLWDYEYYKYRGLPSSKRHTPSAAAKYFYHYLQMKNIKPGRLIDIGAGLGRNTIFFAEKGFNVTAVDISSIAIDKLKTIQKERLRAGKSPNIEVLQHDLSSDIYKLDDDSHEFAIDIFTSKHIIDQKSRFSYLSDLLRVIKLGGYLLVNTAAHGDGYYSNPDYCEHISRKPREFVKGVTRVRDMVNNIESLIFTETAIIKFFTNHTKNNKCFRLIEFNSTHDCSSMHGKYYTRHLYRLIFRCEQVKHPRSY